GSIPTRTGASAAGEDGPTVRAAPAPGVPAAAAVAPGRNRRRPAQPGQPRLVRAARQAAPPPPIQPLRPGTRPAAGARDDPDPQAGRGRALPFPVVPVG